jgi:two-component system NtrC family sensor kinase
MNLYSIPPLLTFAAFFALAVLTLVRWRRQTVNRLFLMICILGAGLNADILFIFNAASAETALLVTRIDQFFSLFLIPLYVHFLHAYLDIRQRRWVLWVFYAVPGVLVWFGMTPLLIASMQRYAFGYFGRAGKLYPLVALAAVLATLYGGWILWRALSKSPDRNQRRRLKYLWTGFVSMAVLTGLNFIPLYGYPLYPPGNFCFIPLLIFAVGLFRHDLLNMGLLIKRGLVYSLLMAALTGIYALIVVAVSRLLGVVGVSHDVALNLLLFVVIAFVFGPLKTGIRKAVDRIFNRHRYVYRQVVRQNSRLITTVLNVAEISVTLVETVHTVMGASHCLLYTRTAQGSRNVLRQTGLKADVSADFPVLLTAADILQAQFQGRPGAYRKNTRRLFGPAVDNHRLDALLSRCKGVIAVPLQFRKSLNGLIVAGEKASGEPYIKEDLDLLETLASHAALAIENAGAYQALDDLNRELEARVAERTRRLQAALEEKERTLEQLVRSESLAAIGQLVAGVAHELNNPLASVKSLLQSVVEELGQGPAKHSVAADLLDDLQFADRELDRAGGIVSSLLGLSRQTQTYREPVDVNQVLRAALRVLKNTYKPLDLAIGQTFAPCLPAIRGNFSNLGQVAINIIGNAIDALPPQKGVIELVTEYRTQTAEVVFACRDNGGGIPAAIQGEIFKPFFTTKPVGNGTGLGLYICHEIVSRHGGTIRIDSPPGEGARVEVSLPVNTGVDDATASIDIERARH